MGLCSQDTQPIPLELLTLADFDGPPIHHNAGLLRSLLNGESNSAAFRSAMFLKSTDVDSDSRVVYPCTMHNNGKPRGQWTLYVESVQSRSKWLQKLEEAIGLHKVVQESNKAFYIETLCADTFVADAPIPSISSQSWGPQHVYTGELTCSVPFSQHRRIFYCPLADILTTINRGGQWTTFDSYRLR